MFLGISYYKGITPLKCLAVQNLKIPNKFLRLTISEFLGSLILCLFAIGASAQYTILGDSFLMPVVGGVLGLMVAVAVVGGLSGAHINPAISFTFATTGEISWFKVPFYWTGQMLGSYTGAGIAYLIYKVQLERHFKTDDLTNISSVSGIFSPFPASESGGIPIWTGLADQIAGTAVYLMSIYSIIDPRNNVTMPPYVLGGFLALVVGGIACAFGINAGGVLNPARDIGPRLMAITIGWKVEDVFTYVDSSGIVQHYWLIPLFGPFIGALLGAWTYILLIGAQISDNDNDNEKNHESEVLQRNGCGSTSTVVGSFRTISTESINYGNVNNIIHRQPLQGVCKQ